MVSPVGLEPTTHSLKVNYTTGTFKEMAICAKFEEIWLY